MDKANAYEPGQDNVMLEFIPKIEKNDPDPGKMNCRLCLAEINESDFSVLDGIFKDMLEIILPELNLVICESPSLCTNCLETLKQAYNFKSSCLEVEDKIHDFMSSNPSCVNLKQMVHATNSIEPIPDATSVCRTCLGVSEESLNTKIASYEGDPLQNMFEKCLPEMRLELTKDPSICSLCLEQLEEQFQFIMQCLDTEAKISCYSESKKIFKGVELRAVHVFSITMEESDELEKPYEEMDSNSDRTMEIKLEETRIKSMGIKEEDGLGVTTMDLEECVFYPEIKSKVEPCSDSEDRRQPNETARQRVMKQKRQTKCDEGDSDDSVTKESDLLDVRRVTCTQSALDESPISKPKPRYYFRTEDDEVSEDELPTRSKRCKFCDFKTTFSSRYKAHMTMNHSNEEKKEEEKMKKVPDPYFRCRQPNCDFKTMSKRENAAHKKQHKKDREQHCNYCGMTFVRPDFLKKHIDNHEANPNTSNVEKKTTCNTGTSFNMSKRKESRNTFSINGQVLKMFKCRLCPYQTRLKSNHERHALTHKKITQIVAHKCNLCNFETIHKENFMTHMHNTHNEGDSKLMKCFLCSFQPADEAALKQHVLQVHKSTPG
ncbi:zinc finger protein 711 [Dendroctonus ponderosae]|uniref:Uncharacterized protein n=1 Tax=Dendroctonus ponderosae TaxID=77166 RepID=U4UW65_DENPD|nr:zinc finger protein 711 [Dendroctonus ponderosae]ERL94511.1 hypothetical protein D910_11788 [Dendroctonus ponderosae]KAH1028050.1 hypothetical protein HUJ05_001454 [Dendroctonus ponderosae]